MADGMVSGAMAQREIPPELLLLVLRHMSAKTLGRACRISKLWRAEERRAQHELWTALWMQLPWRSGLVSALPAKQRFRVQTTELSTLPLRMRDMSATPIIQRWNQSRPQSDPVEATYRSLCRDFQFYLEIHSSDFPEPIALGRAEIEHPDFTSIHPGAVQFQAGNFFASMPDCFCSHEAVLDDRMDWRPTGTVHISVWARRPHYYDSTLRLMSFELPFEAFHDCSARGTELEDDDEALHDVSWFYATSETAGKPWVHTQWRDTSTGMIGPPGGACRVNGLQIGVGMYALRERNAGNWARRSEETSSWTLTGMILFLEWKAFCGHLPQGKTAPILLQLDDLLRHEAVPWHKAIDPLHKDLYPACEDAAEWNAWGWEWYRRRLREVMGDA